MSATPSAALDHVLRVLFRCSSPEMCRINTWRVIAGMQDLVTFRYKMPGKEVGDSVCRVKTAIYAELAVAFIAVRRRPEPAGIRDLGVQPEEIM